MGKTRSFEIKRILSVKEFDDFRKLLCYDSEENLPCLVISAGTCGQASGANEVIRIVKRNIIERNLQNKISLRITGCLGFCQIEPFILVEPGNIIYPKPSLDDISRIINATLEGKVIEELLYNEPGNTIKYHSLQDIPFYKYQTPVILGKSQKVDPIRINDYIQSGGYEALQKVLQKPAPENIINEIKQAELRGRGGAGFYTAKKWEFIRKSINDSVERYLICNADEGDPGAYMDRSLLEGNPHLIIEGMLIAGIAISATKGFIYVRSEYPLAIKHVIIALRQARELGLLGDNILGSGISFDINIVKGAGAFVCGEETALIKSIEGKMGHPKQRPPYPVVKGLWGFPTCINNVETFANVPEIISKGAEEYSKLGIPGTRGTKIFSLVGKIKNTGLVEVPFGTTIRDIVYKIGGGHPKGGKIKAIQTGGPSGGCIPEELFDLTIDYDSLTNAGSIMGSGGMIVMDENTCMVDIAKYFTNFLQNESCGKCSICREGTQRMHEILTNITNGEGKAEDVELLEELGHVIKDASMCGLGQTAANPLLGTLRYFKDEYVNHIEKKKCDAMVCNELISSPCQYICPIDTEAPVYIALIAQGKFAEALEIIKKENPFASVLSRVCHHPCEVRCKSGDGGEPVSIRALKRFVTDYGIQNNIHATTKPAKKTKKTCGESRNMRDRTIKVAVIGSGPAGLTCGYYLTGKGYDVTVFEKESVLGGMLALGIPEYRLPRNILEKDIDFVKSIGMKICTNSALGKDFTIDELFAQGYKAIYIAIGSHQSLNLDIPGEEVEGVIPGMKALSALNLSKKIEIGKKVGIIGGGNTAVDAARRVLRAETSESIAPVDAARSALRTTKPEQVTIFYRRTMAEIPAYKEEVEGALAEGINIQFLTAPKRIISEKGKLKACEFIRMEMGDVDESGRRRPVPVKGSEFTVELDTLIVSISENPDIACLKDSGLELTKWNTIKVNNETFQATRTGVFAGGDAVTGPNTVVDAISSGKVAAESIDQYLCGKEIKRIYNKTKPSVYVEPVKLTNEEQEEIFTGKRIYCPVLSPEKRKYNLMEVELGFTEEQAVKEAKRCLRCDLQTKEGMKFLESI
ncbi:MAG: FAD-dependent oxidoreductase [Bacteroidia bacterium]|nr:FAD-dependent oxidoreductase [Bacteroidia bacterium]